MGTVQRRALSRTRGQKRENQEAEKVEKAGIAKRRKSKRRRVTLKLEVAVAPPLPMVWLPVMPKSKKNPGEWKIILAVYF